MKTTLSLVIICLVLSVLAAQGQTLHPEEPDLVRDVRPRDYCSGLVGNSLAFAFASGVSIAVPALSAGFLVTSLAFAVAAAAVC